MLKLFIERPVLATVISVMVVILGVLAYLGLPVSQYPEIAPPTVQVSATYTGASAAVVQRNVIVPLEEQINGVEGMTYMTSSATNDGAATITIYFRLGTNPDINAVNVQNRVSIASSVLPSEVTRAGVTVQKQQSSNLLIFSLKSDSAAYDQLFLNNYANINLVPEIKRINGVGGVTVFGAKDYSMRIWLKPDVMASYGLTPADVNNVLAEQNIDAAPGKFGENSNQVFQYTIQYTGKLIDTTEFGDIVMRTTADGSILRLRDIARLELGSLTYVTKNETDGKPACIIAVTQVSGSNAQTIIKETIAMLDKASLSFPEGVSYVSLINANDFLSASIRKVLETLMEAYILVFIVVFVFLQDLRSTLIPGISVLVSIVGTCACLSLFGFTINLLTLFALVLAIGIVVDDAIVVVEAVHAKLDEGYASAHDAAVDAMKELGGTLVAITLVMAAVFVPVSFVSGSSGVFFKQFGLTLASAVIISAVNALTLSPALCALFLKPQAEHGSAKRNFLQRFIAGFNTAFDRLKNKYRGAVLFLSRKRWIVPVVVAGFVALLVYCMKTTPGGFVPNEDQGTIIGDISLPPGSSLEKSEAVARMVTDISHKIPAIIHAGQVSGVSIINGNGSNFAILFFKLKPWEERKGIKVDDVVGQLFGMTAGIKDARILFFTPPTVPGFGNSDGFTIELQDRSGGSVQDFYKVAGGFLGALNQRPEILYGATGFNPNYPQYLMSVNVARAKQAGVLISDITGTMQGYYGGVYASTFNQFGKQYRVMVQADDRYRSNIEGLSNIYVKNSSGTMAPISEFVTLTAINGPQSLSRFNLFNNISVIGSPKPGFSSGDALKAIRETAARTLPASYSFDYSGLSREEVNAGSQTIFIYSLCVIFVFFLLSALYESYIIPLAVLCSFPVGLSGVYLFARLLGIDNNIYMQISVVMLIGLLAKNAILIVQYAVARREKGMPVVQAAIEASTARLRPILMTSLAFIFGLMPLMIATGVGAKGNRSIGAGAVGGMLIGTVFGVFVIPVLYIVFETIQGKFSGTPKRLRQTGGAAALLITAILILPSCHLRQAFVRPAVKIDSLYRGVDNPDTAGMADISWTRMFKDEKLQALLREGMDHNYDLKIAVARIKQAEANLQQSKAAFLPALSVGPQYTRQKTTAGQGGVTGNLFELSGGASWEVDLWGKLKGAKKAALARLLQSHAYIRAVQTQLTASIASDYFNLLAFDKELTITLQTVESYKNDVETNKALKAANRLNEASVAQSEANRYAAEVTIPDLQNNIRQLENAISVLVGRQPGGIQRDSIDAEQVDTVLQTGLPAQLLSNRPDVQEAEYNVRYYFEQINVARAYFYPSLSITAQGGWQSATIGSLFNSVSFFGNVAGGLLQPVLNQGLNKQRLRLANAQYEEFVLTFQQTVLGAGQEVSDALYSYQSAQSKLVARSHQLDALERSVDYTRLLLKGGYVTYIDVLTSEQGYLAARLNSVNDRLQQLSAVVSLYQSLGGGWK